MCQSPKETPQDFLIRALDLRQQFLYVSQAEGGTVKYEPSLVHPLFLHAIETGLQDEAVRNKLQPFLQKAEVTDEDLMEQINVVVSEESEWKGKLGATYHKNARLNSLEVDSDQAEPGGQTQPKKSGSRKEMKCDRPNRLMVTLEAVQSDIAVLKEAMASQNASERERVQHRCPFENQRRRVCQACQRANQEFCNHCFRCGSSDHFCTGMSQWCSQCTKSGKPEEATTAGQGVSGHQVKRSHVCINCGRKGVSLKQCSKCQSVHYCSQKCQRTHWMKHKRLCSAIKYLSNQEKRDTSDSGMYVSHLTPNQHPKVAKMHGSVCYEQCADPSFVGHRCPSFYCF